MLPIIVDSGSQVYSGKGVKEVSYLWWETNIFEAVIEALRNDETYLGTPETFFGSIKYFSPIYEWVASQTTQLGNYLNSLPKTGSAAYEAGTPLPEDSTAMMKARAAAFKGNHVVFKVGAHERGNPKDASSGSSGARMTGSNKSRPVQRGKDDAPVGGEKEGKEEEEEEEEDHGVGGGGRMSARNKGKGRLTRGKGKGKKRSSSGVVVSTTTTTTRTTRAATTTVSAEETVMFRRTNMRSGTSPGSVRAGMRGPDTRESPKPRTGGAYGSPEDGPRDRGRKQSRAKPFSSQSIADMHAKGRERDLAFENKLCGVLERAFPAAPQAKAEGGKGSASAMSVALFLKSFI